MMKKALIIVAHPDDEVLGMGGTIAKLTERGVETHLLIVTDGSSSQYKGAADLDSIIEKKKTETKESCAILGIRSVTYGNLPDMKLDTLPHVEINAVVEGAIRSIRPDTVFTHFYGDVNLDHQLVFRSVMVACRPLSGQCVRAVYCFENPSSTEWNAVSPQTVFIPNYFVNIGDQLETKLLALSCYRTELRAYPHPRSIEHIEKVNVAEGIKLGLPAMERFLMIRQLDD